MAKQPSRSDRWMTAVEEAKAAMERINDSAQEMDFNEIESAASDFENAIQELANVKQEYQEWYDGMPENLQGSATGEKLSMICDIDVESANVDISAMQDAIRAAIEEVVSEANEIIEEAESAELPVGFGRD